MDKKDKDKLKLIHKVTLKKFMSKKTKSQVSAAVAAAAASSTPSLQTSPSSMQLLSSKEQKKLRKLAKKKEKLMLKQQKKSGGVGSTGGSYSTPSSLSSLGKSSSTDDYDDDDDDDDDDTSSFFDDDDDDDDDENSGDETPYSPTSSDLSKTLTPKELYNNVVEKQRSIFNTPVHFTPLLEALKVAQEDQHHLLFIVHCVEWNQLCRNMINSIENLLSNDRQCLYFFINQTSAEFKKEYPGELTGVPHTSVYYRQKPFKINRDSPTYDWPQEEKIRSYLNPLQLEELYKTCKESINHYHPDQNFEITLDF
ncbi:hypothetical protein CYY_002228 [Polysphondylium violaceum]|uniref:Thioredoxin domain-containing protein n=1 Tax=Polysphondylium violaceum TaxID=133409 RepID=A0A8J4PX61_9MYCE|nr:hypothetical protein CYY_002228 [Polysphondylium violaceum]